MRLILVLVQAYCFVNANSSISKLIGQYKTLVSLSFARTELVGHGQPCQRTAMSAEL